MICRHCGSQISEGVMFCSSCGARCEKRYCAACGSEQEEKQIFCHVCGERCEVPQIVPVQVNAAPSVDKELKIGRRKVVHILCTAVHIVALGWISNNWLGSDFLWIYDRWMFYDYWISEADFGIYYLALAGLIYDLYLCLRIAGRGKEISKDFTIARVAISVVFLIVFFVYLFRFFLF